MFLESSKGVVSSGMDGPRSSDDVSEIPLLPSLNSVCFHSPAGSCHVAERWLLVAPGLCCLDCLKAREESCLALKFRQSPREDSDWSRPEPITVDHSVTFVLLGQPHRNHTDFCRKGER